MLKRFHLSWKRVLAYGTVGLAVLGVVANITGLASFLGITIPLFPQPDPSKEIIQTVKDESTLNRIYSSPIDYIIIVARFGELKPNEVSVDALIQNGPSVRFDFDPKTVIASVEGQKSFNNPLTPIEVEASAKSNMYLYTIDLTYLRQVDPTHPLSVMTPKNLENVPFQLLVDNDALERVAKLKENNFSISMTAEAAGYSVDFFKGAINSNGTDLLTSRFPRKVPQKPGFVALMLPNWTTSLAVTGKSQLRNISKSVNSLERAEHLKSWRGIWPDKETLGYFVSVLKVPAIEEAVVFHPWNQHFVRLQSDFATSSDCNVPGISAFQLTEPSIFFVFARVECGNKVKQQSQFTVNNEAITLSLNEQSVISNMMRQILMLNETWVKVEGNYVPGLVVLFPERKKYVIVNAKSFLEYAVANVNESSQNMEGFMKNAIQHSLEDIRDLPNQDVKADITPTPSASIVYDDDFHGTTCNWITSATAEAELGCTEDQYRIKVKESGFTHISPLQLDKSFDNLFLLTSARQTDGSPTSFHGLVFRYQDGSHYYMLAMRNDGQFAILKNEDGLAYLVPWTPTDKYKPNELNNIGVLAVDSLIVAQINGEWVSRINDQSLKSGKIGLAVGTFPDETGPAIVEFKRVTVAQ